MNRRWRMVVVLASYNEARSISAVLAELKEAAIALAPSCVDLAVLLVDDDSPDETALIAQDWAQRLGLQLRVARGPGLGLGGAMFEGMRLALEREPDSIVTLDADGQHNSTDIPTLHRAFVAREADLLIGSRWVRGGQSPGTTFLRMLGSRAGNTVFRWVTGTRGVKDATTSFRVYSPRLARHLLETPSKRFGGYSFFSTTAALAEAAGFTISEVPITFRPRYSGTSKFNREEAGSFFRTLGALRRERRAAAHVRESPYRATEELELLTGASNWNALMLETCLAGIEPAEIRRILEVGAGRGGVLRALRRSFPQASLTGIEPDDANFAELERAVADLGSADVVRGDLRSHLTALRAEGVYDLVVYINVLEHINDDLAQLQLARRVVRPGGYLALFIPAMPALYGPIDYKSGHFRRYRDRELAAIVEAAELESVDLRYVDPLGVVPYWINYRLLNKSTLSGGGLWAFENVVVPVVRGVQRLVPSPPFGKNLVCLARRPEQAVGTRTANAERGQLARA